MISRMREFPQDKAPIEDEDSVEIPGLPSTAARIGTVRLQHNLRTTLDEDSAQPAIRMIRAFAEDDGWRTKSF